MSTVTVDHEPARATSPDIPGFLASIRRGLPAESVLARADQTRAYESDGLMLYREMPPVVVLPESEAQVIAVLAACREYRVPVVPRGSGTGLSGGAAPHPQGVVVSLAKFNRILKLDPEACIAVVGPGVRNLAISEAAAKYGLYSAPDPSSQIACSIGGNVAENSGGVHCLKYGLTTHNVLGIEMVTPEGDILRLGGRHQDAAHYVLLVLMIGSEGLLG
ncbi:MAG: FAD-binding protein, partial [Rhodanobacteraceae bacterium]